MRVTETTTQADVMQAPGEEKCDEDEIAAAYCCCCWLHTTDGCTYLPLFRIAAPVVRVGVCARLAAVSSAW